mgnify:CR=1 FL=1
MCCVCYTVLYCTVTTSPPQLYALGLTLSAKVHGIGSSDIVTILLDMYENMGDCLALQYGGSQMHRKMGKGRCLALSVVTPCVSARPNTVWMCDGDHGTDESESAPVLLRGQKRSTKSKEVFVSLMRHYQNSFQVSQ